MSVLRRFGFPRVRSVAWFVVAVSGALVAMAVGTARAGGSPSVVYCTALTGCPAGAVTGFNFGPVDPASPDKKTFYIYNKGGSASSSLKLSILQNTTANAFVIVAGSDTCTGTSIGRQKSCHVTVQYNPTAGKTDTARLNAVAPKPGSVSVSLNLSGSGAAPHVTITSSSFDFLHAEGWQDFTVSNIGTAPTGAYTLSGPADSHFSLLSRTTCDGSSIPVGGACILYVQYTKSSDCGSAVYTSSISIGSLASLPVQAEQDACVVQLKVTDPTGTQTTSTAPYDFGLLRYGSGIGPRTFTVTNTGNATSSTLSVTPSGSDEFHVSNNTCDGQALAPGGSCAFDVTAISSNSCSGLVRQGQFQLSPTSATAYAKVTDEGCASLTLNPASVTLPSGGGTQGVTVKNTGTASSGPLTIGLPGSAPLSITTGTGACDATALQPGDTCTIYVKYAPPTCGDTSVSYTGTLTVGYFNGVSPSAQATANVGAQQPVCPAPANLSLSPGTSSDGSNYSYTFGAVPAGTAQTFTLTNGGGSYTGVLIGSLVQSLSTYYQFSPDPPGTTPCSISSVFILGAGASCTFTITFTLTVCTVNYVHAETAIDGGVGNQLTLTVYGRNNCV